jgi:hypothetical protein
MFPVKGNAKRIKSSKIMVFTYFQTLIYLSLSLFFSTIFSVLFPFSVSLSLTHLFCLSCRSQGFGISLSLYGTCFCFSCLFVSVPYHNAAGELENTQKFVICLGLQLHYINLIFIICFYKSKD